MSLENMRDAISITLQGTIAECGLLPDECGPVVKDLLFMHDPLSVVALGAVLDLCRETKNYAALITFTRRVSATMNPPEDKFSVLLSLVKAIKESTDAHDRMRTTIRDTTTQMREEKRRLLADISVGDLKRLIQDAGLDLVLENLEQSLVYEEKPKLFEFSFQTSRSLTSMRNRLWRKSLLVVNYDGPGDSKEKYRLRIIGPAGELAQYIKDYRGKEPLDSLLEVTNQETIEAYWAGDF